MMIDSKPVLDMDTNHLDTSKNIIRVGAVKYLNARPLIYCLRKVAPQVELVVDVPSRLAVSLSRGELDVAMIPSIEYFRGTGYSIISDACIACRGPVLSVKLFSRVPMNSIRTLALDEGSRTSAALVQILLKEEYDLLPQISSLPIGASEKDTKADAVLLIGDRGIASNNGRFDYEWDLGREWMRWTGLPFVFAMWIARSGIALLGFDKLLSIARDEGLKHIAEMSREEAANGWISEQDSQIYLRDHLHFYFGPEERQGLDLFYQKAVQQGFVNK